MGPSNWQWSRARDIGIGLQVWPLHWNEWRMRRFSSGMGWVMALTLGPVTIELSINAGEDPR